MRARPKDLPALHRVLAVIAVQGSEDLVYCTGDDARDFRKIVPISAVAIPALHGICLPRSGLTIGKDGAVEAFQHLLHYGRDCLMVQPLLARIRPKHLLQYIAKNEDDMLSSQRCI